MSEQDSRWLINFVKEHRADADKWENLPYKTKVDGLQILIRDTEVKDKTTKEARAKLVAELAELIKAKE